jgi:UDP-N-acetylmuramoyl-L-alanyl-D-glutamate--2,6-diaminopimelate ligase
MLSLSELLAGTTILRTGGDPEILSVRVAPSQIAEGKVFFKLRSWLFRISAADAIRQGARYVVLEAGDEEEATLPANVSYAIVDNVNRAFARVCSRMFGDAHQQLTLIGVTGAKGKTTVCHLIEGALRASGFRTGLVSSLVLRLPESERPATNSTPDALSMHSFLAALRGQGGTHAVLELTSFGIEEERLFGLQFDALVFTNLGAGGGAGQQLANVRLFTDTGFHKSPRTLCAFNSDDPGGRELAGSSLGRVVTFGLSAADVTPELYSSDPAGIALRLYGHDLRFPLIGRHNAMNVLAAAAIVVDVTQSGKAVPLLRHVGALPGRMERLPTAIGVDVYLDQAYAPWSVEVALAAVREFAGSRRIVCMIGGSAGTDKGKLQLLAMAALKGSDVCILTSYEPGDQHPASLVMAMLKGAVHAAPGRLKAIIDRPTAISAAIREALPDGIVVLMGKRMMGAELRITDRQIAIDVLHEIRSRSTAEPFRNPDPRSN